MKKIARRLNVAIFLFVGVLPSVTRAEVPNLEPDALQQSAELIITGEVTAINVSTQGALANMDWIVVMEAKVDTVEKGDKSVAGETITVHCWRVLRRTSGWTGASGNHSIPANGSQFRMWLKADDEDGLWKPLLPNGIELLADSPHLDFAPYRKSIGIRNLSIFVFAIAAAVLGFLILWKKTHRSKS